MPGLGTSLGRGAATNFMQDVVNSDCILIIGSNMAEAHPVGFRWPMKAKERGARLIHVDPHFSRTSALCDHHVPIRAGTDIAFIGGIINYILTHDLWFRDYVLHYTNASTLIREGFQDTEDLGGVFSGIDPETGAYDAVDGRWGYECTPGDHAGPPKEQAGDPLAGPRFGGEERKGVHGYAIDGGPRPHSGSRSGLVAGCDGGPPARDPTLQHPRCVFQILRRHFSRYTPEMVSNICGCTPEQLKGVAELLGTNSGRERTSVLVYALGWTQHAAGAQMIRAGGILQLLLGNIGRPGGGILAMRGHSSIQGSTDVGTLYDVLPGYLPQPSAEGVHDSLESYAANDGTTVGLWSNMRSYIVSLLKAWYGDDARPENDFGYNWLPRIERDHSQLPTFDRMAKGELKGYFLFGQNPGGGGLNAGLHRAGLRNLEWLVVADWFPTESATFWKNDPGGPPPSEIGTEVFLLPAAANPEADGTLTNTQRLLQWHDRAIDPPGDCRSDAWYVYNLGRRLKALYAGSTDPKDRAILSLTWDYGYQEPPRLPDGSTSRITDDPDAEKILMEMNGFRLDEVDPRTGRPRLLSGSSELKGDGSTACGLWIYSGVFPEPGRNRARERNRSANPLEPDWGFAWPGNRRVLFNRASADPEGRPWSERKKLIWWDAEAGRWEGADQPDFEPTKPPDYRPPAGATGMQGIAGDDPFILKPDGVAWLFAPYGVKDGPLPTHYEPIESPVPNLLYPGHMCTPGVRLFPGPRNRLVRTPEDEFPVVATTYRLTEHYLSGPMSRFNSWLCELQPEMFVELSPELAAERGIVHGGWLAVRTARGRIEARAMVTRRLRPLDVDGRVVHQVGLPFHWGFSGLVVGANANDLTSLVCEQNTSMHEGKSFACQVEPVRGRVAKLRPTAAFVTWPDRRPIPGTPDSAQPEGNFTHGH
nr:molybdopterin-dependent oxidoreductase [Aquisphaera insulae]